MQVNVWLADADREAFAEAVAPFRKRAQEIEEAGRPPTGYVLRFGSETPPADLRNRMKGAGWTYDRSRNLWSVTVTDATRSAYAEWVDFLERNHRASIERLT